MEVEHVDLSRGIPRQQAQHQVRLGRGVPGADGIVADDDAGGARLLDRLPAVAGRVERLLVAFGKREIPAAGERLLPLRLVERQGDEALLAAVAHVHDLVEADALQLGADLLENLPAIRVRLARDNEQVSAGEVRQRVLVALLVDAEAVDLDRADAVLVRAGGVVVVVAVVLVGVHPVAFRSSREAILPGPSRG